MEIEVEDEDTGSPPPPVPPSPARREDRSGERRPSNTVNELTVTGPRGKPQKVVEKPSAETTRLRLGSAAVRVVSFLGKKSEESE